MCSLHVTGEPSVMLCSSIRQAFKHKDILSPNYCVLLPPTGYNVLSHVKLQPWVATALLGASPQTANLLLSLSLIPPYLRGIENTVNVFFAKK